MRIRRVLWITGLVVLVLVGGIAFFVSRLLEQDPFMPMYVEHCSVCHGEHMEGAAQGPALVGTPLKHGESVAEIARSIGDGFPASGMPPWSATLQPSHVQSLAILVAEQRVNRKFTDFKMDKPLVVPDTPYATELTSFRLETVATGIDPYPF